MSSTWNLLKKFEGENYNCNKITSLLDLYYYWKNREYITETYITVLQDECEINKSHLTFYKKNNLIDFMNHYKKDNINLLLLDVNIPYDANVIKSSYPNEYITNKYIIKNKRLLSNDNELFYIGIQKNGEFIRFLDEQTEEICKLAVKVNPDALYYVKEQFQTDEICKLAIEQSYCTLNFVNNQTEEICKFAITKSAFAIKYVKEQFYTEEICKLAVSKNGLVIEFIKDEFKTDEICKLAVKQNGLSMKFIKDEFKTDEICKLAVKQNGYSLKYVINQTEEICNLAVQSEKNASIYIKDDKMYNLILIQNQYA
jgi:hypothetical protein